MNATTAVALANDPALVSRRRILHAAWMAIALAILIEVLLVLLRQRASAAAAVADFAGKVSWSVIVCGALAVARAAGKGAMGVVGLLASPLALTVARMSHKAASQALGLPPSGAMPAWAILVVKSIEYAALGLAIEWLVRRGLGMKAHASAGLAVGALFGGTIVGMQAPADALVAVSQGVNEVLFPVGCSLTLYAADRIAKRGAPGTTSA